MITTDRRTLLTSALAIGAVGASPVLARTTRPKPLDPAFPTGFLWGASTAAHQVEGNNLNADLWVIENVPGTIFADRSGDAANSLELWPVDLDLVQGMGLNSYRFSLEWARIEPDKGHFSAAMLDHYKAMIAGCRQRGLKPVVTFNHFTTPRWFAAQGGWGNPESPELFARFCSRAARHLAAGIELALTLNEPNLAGLIGEILPPQLLAGDKAMQEAARQRGLKPVVTFNHFTTPRWFAAQGGWGNPEAPELFARFCSRAARNLAAGIELALTLNEPNLAGLIGEILPPQLLAGDKAMQEAAARQLGVPRYAPGVSLYVDDVPRYRANMMEGHRRGVAAIKAVRPDLPVGVSLAMLDDQVVGRNSIRDRMRERYYGEWLRLAAQTCDFVGVQNYERKLWDDKGEVPTPADARRNTAGTEVWPGSLAGAVRYAWEATRLPIYVTEHGVNSDDDRLRQWLIPAALTDLKRVIDDGVPVHGYFHWSLIDNFEWGFGYKYRFGLHSFDAQTFARTAKPSAEVLGAIARRNRL